MRAINWLKRKKQKKISYTRFVNRYDCTLLNINLNCSRLGRYPQSQGLRLTKPKTIKILDTFFETVMKQINNENTVKSFCYNEALDSNSKTMGRLAT